MRLPTYFKDVRVFAAKKFVTPHLHHPLKPSLEPNPGGRAKGVNQTQEAKALGTYTRRHQGSLHPPPRTRHLRNQQEDAAEQDRQTLGKEVGARVLSWEPDPY